MFEYQARHVRTIDGDTIVLDIDLGLETVRRITVRLAGVDAPERSQPGASEASAWLTRELRDGTFRVRTIKDRREKFGRYVVEIFTDPDPQSVNDRMVAAGHAVQKDYR